jgi:hypothetical protein
MNIIQHVPHVLCNTVFDLELGLAIVALALAVEAFITRKHLHGCLYCCEVFLVFGLALCAALETH